MGKVWALGLSLVCLLLSEASSGQKVMSASELKRAALETVEVIRGVDPGPLTAHHWPKENRCNMSPQNLYAGKPLLVRNLIVPTEDDLERMRRRIQAARREAPSLVGEILGGVRAARRTYRDSYQVPIYHRTCGYMFHVVPEDEKDAGLGWGGFTPISAERAQTLLGVAELPVFVNFYGSLTPSHDGLMWVAGSRAVNAFKPSKRYRIVNRAGEPFTPSKMRLELLISRESFATSMGGAATYWGFQLPIRLEPLPPPN